MAQSSSSGSSSINFNGYKGHLISKLFISYKAFKNAIMNYQTIYFIAHEVYTNQWGNSLNFYNYYFINKQDCILNNFEKTVSIKGLGLYKEADDGTYLERISRSLQSVEEYPSEPGEGGEEK